MKSIPFILLLLLASCNLLKDAESGPGKVTENSADMSSDVEDVGKDVASESCFDNVKNGSETDLNCGGECRPCTDNLTCRKNADCSSGVCSEDICSPAACDDGIKNGTESDLDCGGLCNPCETGSACVSLRDCLSEICSDSLCVGVCDSKCGRDCPAKCIEGDPCNSDFDCGAGLWCDDVCSLKPEGWKQSITFVAPAASLDFYAYVRVPDFVEADADKFVFEKDGVAIPSERAEENGAFWVYIADVDAGSNTFELKMDANASAAVGEMWSDQVAVFHAPGLLPVKASNVSVIEAVNVQPTPGHFGGASLFNGTGYVITNGAGVEETFPSFTLSVWARFDVISTRWKPLFGRQFADADADDFVLSAFTDGRLWACAAGRCVISVNPQPLDEWILITMAHDGSGLKLYLNGELDGEGPRTRVRSTSGNPISIGGDTAKSSGAIDAFFVGALDELRISSTVQTSDAIRLEYLSADPAFLSFGDRRGLME